MTAGAGRRLFAEALGAARRVAPAIKAALVAR